MERTVLNVTKTYLPPLEEYVALLREIWNSSQLTNKGPMLCALEDKLKRQLDENRLFTLCNGAMGLHLAINAYGLRDAEVITTPFSFVATTSALIWEGAQPVFADIEPDTLCIDPAKVEALITPKTKAILATHVFGNPCDIETLEAVATRHNLKLIFDAAHAYGATYRGRSLVAYGDASMVSFHATKIFHTAEGGLMYVRSEEDFDRMDRMRRFGITGPDTIECNGTNFKMSELSAAMGLCIIERIPELIRERRRVCETYERLIGAAGLPLILVKWREAGGRNYAYFPVIFETESALLKTVESLRAEGIVPRRYFYPSLNTLPFIPGGFQSAPVSESVSNRILCRPLTADLPESEISRVVEGMARSFGKTR